MSEWGATEKSYQDYVFNYFSDKGLPANSIFGLMGNASQESSWEPWQNQVGGTAYGLWQWDGDRKVKLQAYGTDLEHQCNFLWSELTGENTAETGASYNWIDKNGYSHDTFMNGGYSPSEAAAAFCYCWERAGIPVLSYRQSEAEYFATQYEGVTPTPPPIPMPSTAKSKIIYIYGKEDSLFGRRANFYGDLTVLLTIGNRSLVKDSVGNVHEVNKKYMNIN
jgi:hypothetical protein